MNNSSTIKGYGYASLSAITFGTIPLFSIPVMESGMLLPSVLIYRFAFGCLFMMAILLWRKQNLHIRWGDGLRITFLSILYAVSAVCLFSSYEYMPGGIATTLLFSYPVWTEILLILFFNEKLTIRISLAILLAIAGVAFLGGIGHTDGIKSMWGVTLAMSLVRSLTLIDSASVAILGAFEPLTAMTIGITLMGEPLTTSIIIGCVLIITSVIILITKGKTLPNPLKKYAEHQE